nr:ATPase 9, plasma membrane-type-like [Tanacetum cinerariifolium]
MRDLIQKRTRKHVFSVELDLWLWPYGISDPSLQHHCNGLFGIRRFYDLKVFCIQSIAIRISRVIRVED